MEDIDKIIDQNVLEKINGYIKRQTTSGPFDEDDIEHLKQLLSSLPSGGVPSNFNIESFISIYRDVENKFEVLKNLDRAVYAYICILLGKCLNSITEYIDQLEAKIDTETSKKELRKQYSDALFGSDESRASRYNKQLVARIPGVESWSFLGITKLEQIAPIVKDYDSDDPIGDVLKESSYQFTLESSESDKDFTLNFRKYLNLLKFKVANLNASEEDLKSLTKAKSGIVPDSMIKKIQNAVTRGSSVSAAISNIVAPKQQNFIALEDEVDYAPEYNELEETCYKLMSMCDAAIKDKYIHEYKDSDRSTWLMLQSVLAITTDLIEFWEKYWKTFNGKDEEEKKEKK